LNTLSLEQNSVEWDSFRQSHIGSSDSPIILGHSKYLTKDQLLQIKLGKETYKANEFVTSLGHRFEPRARAHINLMIELNLEPMVAIHKDYEWLSASFDGIDIQAEKLAEFKYVGEAKLEAAKKGDFDISHYIQMQHQMFVSGISSCIYCCYTLAEYREIDDIYFVEIPFNSTFAVEQLFPKLEEFYNEYRSIKDTSLS
jgi:putative phage-type endonuclease